MSAIFILNTVCKRREQNSLSALPLYSEMVFPVIPQPSSNTWICILISKKQTHPPHSQSGVFQFRVLVSQSCSILRSCFILGPTPLQHFFNPFLPQAFSTQWLLNKHRPSFGSIRRIVPLGFSRKREVDLFL